MSAFEGLEDLGNPALQDQEDPNRPPPPPPRTDGTPVSATFTPQVAGAPATMPYLSSLQTGAGVSTPNPLLSPSTVNEAAAAATTAPARAAGFPSRTLADILRARLPENPSPLFPSPSGTSLGAPRNATNADAPSVADPASGEAEPTDPAAAAAILAATFLA